MHFFYFRSSSVVDDARHWRNGWVSRRMASSPVVSAVCFRMFKRRKRLRCSPLFFEGMSSSRIWLREGRRCPTSFDGHDLFCHFKQSERCHGNLAISCKRTALRPLTKTISVFAARAHTSQQAAERGMPCCRLLDNTDESFHLVQRHGGWYDGLRANSSHAPKKCG